MKTICKIGLLMTGFLMINSISFAQNNQAPTSTSVTPAPAIKPDQTTPSTKSEKKAAPATQKQSTNKKKMSTQRSAISEQGMPSEKPKSQTLGTTVPASGTSATPAPKETETKQTGISPK